MKHFIFCLFVSICLGTCFAQIESSVYYQQPDGIKERYYKGKTIYIIDGFKLGECFPTNDPQNERLCDSLKNFFPEELYNYYYERLLFELKGPTNEIREFRYFGNDSLNVNICYLYSKVSKNGFCEINDKMSLFIPVDSIKNVTYCINELLVKDTIDIRYLMQIGNDSIIDYYYNKSNNTIYINVNE